MCAGLIPIKLNVVALKGYNDDEFVDLARLSMTYPFHIRFIEYMPIGNAQMKSSDYILTPEIQTRLSVLGNLFGSRRNAWMVRCSAIESKAPKVKSGLFKP